MLPNSIENFSAVLRISEFLLQWGFQIRDEGERGPVFRVIAIRASSRSNEKSRQQ